MSLTFTKLFSSITDSSIWSEDSDTKVVWITMLAMADEFGRVHAALPGLAKRAAVPLEATIKAVDKFLSPDPYSRTTDHEGRRIEAIEGGWRLLNYAMYRKIRQDEDRKEQTREAVARHRAKKCKHNVSNVSKCNQCKPNAEAEAEAEAEADSSPLPPRGNGEEEVIEAWNQSGLPQCLVLSPKRKSSLKARLAGAFWRENWREALERIKVSPWCLGENDRGWRANFDFFCRPDTVVKAMEGKYAAAPQPAAARPTQSTGAFAAAPKADEVPA